MPRKTYTQINSVTLAAASSSVTFASIPQNYRDLVLIVNGAGSSGQGNNYLYFNNDTTAGNYAYVRMLGDGSSTSSAIASNPSVSDVTTSFNNTVKVDILDYSASDKHKTRLSTSSNPTSTIIAYASRWANTAPVTSLTFAGFNSGNWVTGTTFTLYGIEA
jgi:hypothetical protein